MAWYLQPSCTKCGGYLGIMVPERKAKDTRAGDQWTVHEMWLPLGMGYLKLPICAPEGFLRTFEGLRCLHRRVA